MKKWIYLCFFMALFCVVAVAWRVSDARIVNEVVEQDIQNAIMAPFEYYDDATVYDEGVPVKDMSLSSLNAAIRLEVATRTGMYLETLELPADLIYYSEPDLNSQAVIHLKKGERVYFWYPVSHKAEMWNLGYGALTLPDYDPRWRCAIPFIKMGDKPEPTKEPAKYYVRSSDIKKVIAAYYEELYRANSIEIEEAELSRKVINNFLQCDMWMYIFNIFDSPALHISWLPIWNITDTILLSCGAAFLLVGISLLFCKRKRRTV